MTRKKDVNQAGNGGEFAARTHDDADASLDADAHPFRFVPAEDEHPYVGAIVRHLDRIGRIAKVDDDGRCLITGVDGDNEMVVADDLEVQKCSAEYLHDQWARFSRIRYISASLGRFKPHECDDMAIVARAINDGVWGEFRSAATSALIDASESPDADLWLVDTADQVYETGYQGHRDDGSDSYFAALQVASLTARALAARHLIGKAPGWTQEAYDHLTRPWRVCGHFVHSDDEVAPASWAKRPLGDDDLARLTLSQQMNANRYARGAEEAAKALKQKGQR